MWNLPNILTLLRIIVIPALVIVYVLDRPWSGLIATVLFVAAAITDWADGYFARKMNLQTAFGAFLDPVADKLIVSTSLIVLIADPKVLANVYSTWLLAVSVAVIVGREIVVSALREWMATEGSSATVAVSMLGKVKTTFQMIAIGMLLYHNDLWGIPVFALGELLLYLAAGLTLWSMMIYLKAAWPILSKS
ncbi:MAG TPA: CDP-diacylglycerol--glycerol-3-phosphate 3-phosphatidyltransferase [Gammaproteobacteria bacterium]|jgi:CDP-diacylglycerol---glycerol-3-phosphate 3-phosphatidyltransferase|nr:CDP-diacylglycerol--glycerol-3-phosphate 3-phosphatidyltransferase [Gammaproteobacteria bacterium]